MCTKDLRLKAITTVVLMAILLYSAATVAFPELQARSLFDSPLPTPSPLPSPSPTPWPTIFPDLPNAERALQFVAQRQGIPREWLILAEAFTVELPLTEVALWRGLVLDIHNKHHPLYEVFIQEGTKEILTGSGVDPQIYWQAEETALRERLEDHILDLAARRAKVRADELEIAAGFIRPDQRNGQWVWQGTVTDDIRGRIYRIAVDAKGQEIDPEELEKANAEARRAKYGKLEPKLFYLLPTLEVEEKIKVLLWVSGVDYAWVTEELARQYPQVRAYRFARGRPVDERGHTIPAETELSEKIRASYRDLLKQAHRKAAEPVAAFLAERGYEVEITGVFPGVIADLPSGAIEGLNQAELGNLSDIYLGEIKVMPQMDSVTKTIRVTSVWDNGYTGAGLPSNVRLGIMDDGIVVPPVPGTTHPAFYGKQITVNPADPADDHAAQVAGVMLGNDSRYPDRRGVAWGSPRLVSVRVHTVGNIESGLEFLLDNDAYAVVASISFDGSQAMQLEDRIFDYLVRAWDQTVVIASGNTGANVTSPAKAYNVIAVGGYEDKNDPYWRNDSIWAGSSYVDPYVDGSYQTYDREKPEVVAVAAHVTTVADNFGDAYAVITGTSAAAPQAAGLAGLLMEKYTWLKTNPETVKAIIMASAIHDIEGWTTLSDKDGAGGIVASEALAVFERGGWAHILIEDMNNPNTYFSGDGSHYDFKSSDFDIGTTYASAGERVRAVVTWDSNPTTDYSTPGTDKLSTNFDLQIVDPDGNPINWPKSISWANNYEIVDFVAKKSGEYKMRVTFHRESLESSWLGVGLAWLRVPAQYLPDIKARYGAWWDSEVVIRNEAATDKDVTITYLNPDGTYEASVSHIIPKNGTWSHRPRDYPTYLYEFSGSAIVSAGEDVSVVVETKNSSSGLVKAYTGVASPETEAYLPALYNGPLTSEITVQNTESSDATIRVRYYKRNGDPAGQYDYSIPKNGSVSFTPPASMGDDGSATITSDKKIATVSTTTWSGGRTAAYTALTTSDTELYAPSVYRVKSGDQWLLFSATILQNTTTDNADPILHYINRDTGQTDLTVYGSILAYAAQGYNTNDGGSVPASTFYPLGDWWDGSVLAISNRALAGIGTTIWGSKNAAGHYRLFSPGDGRSSVILPLQYRHKSGGTWQRWSAVNVMNVGSQPTTVYFKYYDEAGSWKLTLTEALDPGRVVGANTRNGGDFNASAFDPLGTNFTGSVLVTASGGDQSIVAIANLVYPDMAAVYDGIGR